MYQFRTWYAPDKMLLTIGDHGQTIYERELLRVIFLRYIKAYAKNTKEHKINILLSYKDFKPIMGRKMYFDTIRTLKEKDVIEYVSVRGSRGGQQVGIITNKIVCAIKAKRFDTNELLESDTIHFT